MLPALLFRTFVIGIAGAAGAAIGRNLVDGDRKTGRVKNTNPYYSRITYPPTQVACPSCGGCFSVERLNDNRARVETVREPDPQTLPGREGHFGLRDDLERRRRADRGTVFRSQAPQEG